MSSLNYEFHSTLNLIELHPTGVVKIADILSYSKEVLTLGIVTEGTVEYYDFSEMTNLAVDYQSANSLQEALRDWVERGWLGSVYFTPNDYQYGIIRMLSAILDSIEGAAGELMVPSREPVALGDVRAYIAERIEHTLRPPSSESDASY